MLEPEYYLGQVQGIHTKYRDYYYNPTATNSTSTSASCAPDVSRNDIHSQGYTYGYENEIESSHLLEERQPLMVVPIPFTNSWLNEGIRGDMQQAQNEHEQEFKEVNAAQEEEDHLVVDVEEDEGPSTDSNPKKRGRSNRCCTTEPTRKNHKRENPTEGPDGRLSSTFSTSHRSGEEAETWWGEGYMGSDIHQTPVLAKLYYDDNTIDERHRLKLNDVVELVGLVSMDPLEAAAAAAYNDNHDGLLDGCMDSLIPPPPSLLPRLHVLRHTKVDLDRLANTIALNASPIPPIRNVDSDRNFTIQTFSEHIFNGNAAAGEALLLSLLSLAERNVSSSSTITTATSIQMPSGKTLGCASLNIVCSNVESCNILQDRLSRVLGDILPTMNSLFLSLDALNQQSFTPPTKNMSGRLEPSVMQMPKGSCLVINQGPITNGVVNENGKRALTSLAKMTESHLIPYRFDGMMDLEFEADLQIIVLSTSNKRTPHDKTYPSKLLPCSMRIDCGNSAGGSESLDLLPSAAIGRIRQFIARSRDSIGVNSTNIALPRELLSKAQHDFVERRKEGRKYPTCVNFNPEISEEDFHRWLTITRLETRSCREGQLVGVKKMKIARISDWESALLLDDQMM